jgi:alkaline phosphatase D
MPDATDSWTGYASERAALLSVMHTIPNLIIISGDRHEVAVVEYLPPTEGERPLLEASVSPLSQTSSPFFGWLLRKQSAETVTRVRTELQLTEEDKEETVVIEEEVPRERLLKGLAYGNNRWCVSAL